MPFRALALAALAILLGADAGLAQTTAQSTSDPLRGERRLLPLDDMAVMLLGEQADGSVTTVLPVLTTSQNTIVGGALLQPAVTGEVWEIPWGFGVGRMFAAPRDTLVVAIGHVMAIYFGPGLTTVAPVWSGVIPNPVEDAHTLLGALTRPLMAMADFTGDGYDEMVIGTANVGGLQVASAVDLTDPTKGLKFGVLLTGVNSFIAGSALTTGDFDGDGLPEVALAYPAGGTASSPATAFRVEIYKADPTELSLSFEHAVTVDTTSYGQGSFPIRKVSITAGDFDNDVSDLGLADEELLVTASGEDETANRFVIQTFKVLSTLQPVAEYGEVHTTADFGDAEDPCDQFICPFVSTVVESARLDWTGALEQAVVGIYSFSSLDTEDVSQFWVLRFDGDDGLVFEVVTKQPIVQQATSQCSAGLSGLAIGNFDRPPSGQPATIPASLSIAVLQGYGAINNVLDTGCEQASPSSLSPTVFIWTVDPSNDFSVAIGLSDELGFTNVGNRNQFMTLLTGDWQGGSLWLGPPEIVPLEDLAQLEVVLQAPPMHLDFIQPIDETSPNLLNLSFGLPGFNTKFTETAGTSTTTSHQSTTSNTFAEKESAGGSVSFGVPEVASVSVDVTEATQQTQQQVVSQSSTTISTTVDSITAASDLDDRLWYMQQDVDLYVYPVLCPPIPVFPIPDACGTTPSHLMFSIPQRQTLHSFVPGATVEWYQPPHQVAQALSYPWTKTQLEDLFPTATLDTKLEVPNLPAAGPLDTTFQWNGVLDTTESIGKTNTYSFDTSISISAGGNADIDIFNVGAKTSESFSFSTSNSVSTLNTAQTRISGSIGFVTNVPDSADLRTGNPDYGYDFDVLVFGQTHPPCPTTSSDDDAASDKTCLYDDRTLTEEITTQGTLWAGYTIDLSDGGSWWTAPDTDYFTLHDIALSHPQRWVRDSSQGTGDNCLLDSSSSTELCYVSSPDSLQPSDIWTNEFYQMKGFFVVPAARDEGGEFLAPQGPQTAVINADGQVWLQARVHNYSFVATDRNGDGSAADGNAVHVRFYAQEWDATNHVPLAGRPSVLVDEVVLDQCIPGHSSDTITKAACTNGDADNWVLATTSQPFDPVSAGIDPGTNGTYVVFWVVAWMENSSGALVPEVTEHGLTGLPGNLTSLTAAGALSETYGNNLGFFHLPTFVCPSGVDCSNVGAAGATEADETAAPEVRITKLEAPRRPIAAHAPTEVRALLRAGEVSPRAVHTALYEGDPEVDGQIFDVELVPYLRGNDSYLIRTNYRPDSCGPRDIVVVADAGGGLAPVTKAAEVNVSADPRFEVRALKGLLAAADLPRKDRQAVARGLREAALGFGRGKVMRGFDALEDLRTRAWRSKAMPLAILDGIDARIDAFAACVLAAGGELARTPRFRHRRR